VDDEPRNLLRADALACLASAAEPGCFSVHLS
jgi:hypothetical protein